MKKTNKDKNFIANQRLVLSSLRAIARKYGIKKLVKVKSGDKYCLANGEDTYLNSSYLIGGDEVHVGIYDDEELLIASFFHELGHIVENKNNKYNSETVAWLNGFKLAKQHGYTFTEKVYLWAIEQLSTYDNEENRWKL